jgi:hypothetical protein
MYHSFHEVPTQMKLIFQLACHHEHSVLDYMVICCCWASPESLQDISFKKLAVLHDTVQSLFNCINISLVFLTMVSTNPQI